MPRKCTVCTHAKRKAIDRLLVGGPRSSFLDIAKRFGLSKSAVYGHYIEHLPEQLQKAHEAQEIATADDLTRRVNDLLRRLEAVLERAEEAGDDHLTLKAAREIRPTLELLGRLFGKIQDAQVVNVLVNPQWIETRNLIMNALADYPQARQAVATALTEPPGVVNNG